MKVYQLKNKNDEPLFVTALGALRHQIAEVYVFEDEELLRRAQEIVADDDEGAALRLLESRSDYEYEGFEATEVRE